MGYDFKKLSILVVEDTTPMLNLITTVLETMGVGKIITAADGNSGYKKFCRDRPDIVMSDWHMEPMSGMELLKLIRTDKESPNKTVPVIMITGYSALPRIAEARDTGATEFLVKPFSANDLARRIAHVISKPRDFVEVPDYFGPDRRRRKADNFSGPLRRESDKAHVD